MFQYMAYLTQYIAQVKKAACNNVGPSGICIDSLPHQGAAGQADIKNILTIVFASLGAVAVILVIIGGIKYAGSQGDPAGTALAKNTIIYAIVGVVVAIFAVTIVQFAVGNIFK